MMRLVLLPPLRFEGLKSAGHLKSLFNVPRGRNEKNVGSNFGLYRRAQGCAHGALLVILNFAVVLLARGTWPDTNLLLHLGVVVGLIGICSATRYRYHRGDRHFRSAGHLSLLNAAACG
jgi:hypothetical protein